MKKHYTAKDVQDVAYALGIDVGQLADGVSRTQDSFIPIMAELARRVIDLESNIRNPLDVYLADIGLQCMGFDMAKREGFLVRYMDMMNKQARGHYSEEKIEAAKVSDENARKAKTHASK